MEKFIKSKEFYCEIYRHNIVVILTNSSKSLSKKYNIKLPKKFLAYFSPDGQTVYLIFKYNHPTEKVPLPETIAHESLHAANYILDRVGVKLSYKNDEAQNYLMTWIIKNTINILNKFIDTIENG